MRPTWTHTFESFATFMHHYAKHSIYLPLRLQRKLPVAIIAGTGVHIERLEIDGVPAAWFRNDDTDPDRVLYYLHGGGYSIGSIDSHQDLLRRLCVASGAGVLAIDYRLAPEHPFPAQLDDALSVYQALLASGRDPNRIVIAGESAGGALTLSTLMRLRDSGTPMPAAGVCLSPWVDLEARSASYVTNARFDYLGRRAIKIFAKRFVEPQDLRNPLAAPIHAELSGLPPLLVHAGGAEVLVDECSQLVRNAREAGVEVEYDIWPDMIHAFHAFARMVPEGREAIEQVGKYVRRQLARSEARDSSTPRAQTH